MLNCTYTASQDRAPSCSNHDLVTTGEKQSQGLYHAPLHILTLSVLQWILTIGQRQDYASLWRLLITLCNLKHTYIRRLSVESGPSRVMRTRSASAMRRLFISLQAAYIQTWSIQRSNAPRYPGVYLGHQGSLLGHHPNRFQNTVPISSKLGNKPQARYPMRGLS